MAGGAAARFARLGRRRLQTIVSRLLLNKSVVFAVRTDPEPREIAAGFDRAAVEKVTRLIRMNEYKRRQSPVGIRVTHRSFGKDWRYPMTNRFRA